MNRKVISILLVAIMVLSALGAFGASTRESALNVGRVSGQTSIGGSSGNIHVAALQHSASDTSAYVIVHVHNPEGVEINSIFHSVSGGIPGPDSWGNVSVYDGNTYLCTGPWTYSNHNTLTPITPGTHTLKAVFNAMTEEQTVTLSPGEIKAVTFTFKRTAEIPGEKFLRNPSLPAKGRCHHESPYCIGPIVALYDPVDMYYPSQSFKSWFIQFANVTNWHYYLQFLDDVGNKCNVSSESCHDGKENYWEIDRPNAPEYDSNHHFIDNQIFGLAIRSGTHYGVIKCSNVPYDLLGKGVKETKNLFAVYMAGDNSLYNSSCQNIGKMINSGDSDANASVVAFIDWPGTDYDGIWGLGIYGLMPLWRPSAELNSGDVNTLAFFLKYLKACSADRYILDLYDHGNGYRGVCWDDPVGSYISLPDLRAALAASDIHFNLIVFDACLMDMVEVAYELRGSANVMVASEELKYAEIIPPYRALQYTEILQWLRAHPHASDQELGSRIVIEYVSTWQARNATQVTLVAIDLSKIQATAIALNNLAAALNANMGTYRGSINTAIENTQRFPWFLEKWPREWQFRLKDFGDIIDFTNQLDVTINDPQIKNADNAVRATVQQAVIKAGALGSRAYGLSVWLPSVSLVNSCPYYDFPSNLAEYQRLQFAHDTKWGEFISGFITGRGARPTADIASAPRLFVAAITPLDGTRAELRRNQ
jgi:hypothetical protein